jgi:hydrogenase nickel incorporation protein HypB
MCKKIEIKKVATSKNDLIAQENKDFFKAKNINVINMISSPGSGKTALLQILGAELREKLAVITGDIQTTIDADRISESGAQAIQIETGGGCHLTAEMIKNSLAKLDWEKVEILVIENIGNLVCPSNYVLGEEKKIALLSVAEGDEKPIKYPALFLRADAVVITKIDLAPYVDFNFDRAVSDCKKLNTKVKIFKTSTKTKEGIQDILDYLT